jgi:ADP-ribose pyrophosphatase
MSNKRTVFENNFIRVESQADNGREIITIDRVKTQTGAIVVPVMENGHIALVREYRHGPGKYVIGVVKGASDREDESATEVAVRELKEELGMTAKDLVETSIQTYALPSLSATRGRVVFAYGCQITSEPDMEPDEDVSIFQLVSKAELAEMLRDGVINDGESCLALQAYLLASIVQE